MYRNIAIVCLFTFLFSAEITDVQASQRTDGSGIIDIYYRLTDYSDIPSFTIMVEISFDNGDTFSLVSSGDLSGDVGENVAANNNDGIENLKHIEYLAPSGYFTESAIIKISGEGHYVTSELPFAMITIDSNSAVTNFGGEEIDYSYQIMQHELTNASLVEWLESYSFSTAVNFSSDSTWQTENAAYNCLDYSTFFRQNDHGDNMIMGCTDSNAFNYNPLATESDEGSCVYESNLGCWDSAAVNWDNNNVIGPTYNDCSCSYIEVVSNSELEEFCNEWGECYSDYCEWGMIMDSPLQSNDGNFSTTYKGCGNPDAINFVGDDFINSCDSIQSGSGGVDCCIFENSEDMCIYECDEQYPWDNPTYDSYPYVKVKDFKTTDIFWSGTIQYPDDGEDWSFCDIDPYADCPGEVLSGSFNIAEETSGDTPFGYGPYPVRFNNDDCIHSVILSLYMDYFGLRIPTGGEWLKAARGDDQRCWPWMDESCESASLDYCDDNYNCLTNDQEAYCLEQTNNCFNECESAFFSCQDSLNDNISQCVVTNIITTEDEVCTSCIEFIDDQITGLDGCFSSAGDGIPSGLACACNEENSLQFAEACSSIIEECTTNGIDCNLLNPHDSQNICVDQTIDLNNDGEADNPSCVGGEYDDFCTASGGCNGNLCNNDACFNDCLGMNDCTVFEDCSDCISTDFMSLENYVNNNELDLNNYMSYLYYDRFNLFANQSNDENTRWDLKPVTYYDGSDGNGRDGRSLYNIYNMIGNVPEVVIKNNTYYLMGLTPTWEYHMQATSFCLDENWNGSGQAVPLLENPQNYPNQQFFGVRLVRTAN
jgi:hypothetical protein